MKTQDLPEGAASQAPLTVPLPLSSGSSSQTNFSEPSTSSSRSNKRRKTLQHDFESVKRQGDEFLSLFREAVEDNKRISLEIVDSLKEQKETDKKIIHLLEKLVDTI